jgi:hypothetical protein
MVEVEQKPAEAAKEEENDIQEEGNEKETKI